MAHADYTCCAICDRKVNYSPDSEAKEVICTQCLKNLHKAGVMVYTSEELLEWMKNNPDKAVDTLLSVGFSTCGYGNPIDDTFRELSCK